MGCLQATQVWMTCSGVTKVGFCRMESQHPGCAKSCPLSVLDMTLFGVHCGAFLPFYHLLYAAMDLELEWPVVVSTATIEPT